MDLDVETFGFGLLRWLYIQYSHGGLSGRHIKSLLLETILSRNYGQPIVYGNLDTPTLAKKKFEEEGEPGFQYMLFPHPLYLNDQEYRRVIIAAIQLILEASPDPVSRSQEIALESAGRAFGLYENWEAYRVIARMQDPYELYSLAWRRNWYFDMGQIEYLTG